MKKRRGRGRPKLGKSARRRVVAVRLSPQEWRHFSAAAKAAGVTVGKWMRAAMMLAAPTPLDSHFRKHGRVA